MFRNLLVLLLSTFLLFSCSKEKKEKVISEPTNEEQGQILYQEAVQSLKEGDAFYAGKKFKEAESLLSQYTWASKASLMASYAEYSRNAYANAIFSLEKHIQGFFDKISETISSYKILKADEKKRIKIEKIERERSEKIEIEEQKKQEEVLKTKLKEQALRDEKRLEKQRTKDIKLFLRKEQALLRIEQAEKQKQFLKQLRLDKQIEKFRIREVKELERLEKISLREKREDYGGLQERIDKLKEKYRIIRDQKIKERVEALGVKLQGDEDRETLLLKEKEYSLARQKIEFALESFYRSAGSLVFQLNKRHITRNMSIFRCIDRRFETGEVFIKWDESEDEEWLLLIYIKNNSPDEGIVIEDKTNPEKNISHEFRSVDIFKASDTMVDSLTQLIARQRAKNSD